MPLWDKVGTIATKLYGAGEITADTNVRQRFRELEAEGFGKFPICMAKTQYSFSTDPRLKGAPSGHSVAIRELRLSAGAEFLVVVTGDIMTMPGLPKTPAANAIGLNDAGEIEGLF
jgi:formate--tetrahydrofolate ligase